MSLAKKGGDQKRSHTIWAHSLSFEAQRERKETDFALKKKVLRTTVDLSDDY